VTASIFEGLITGKIEDGTVDRCYSAGDGQAGLTLVQSIEGTGSVNGSFFDGVVANSCSDAHALSTTTMQLGSPYVAASWNFTSV
jgi:hypothetical protein